MTDDRRGNRRGGPPPRRPGRPEPQRPPLPADPPRLPGPLYRDLRAAAPPAALKDVAAAYGAAGDALEEGETRRAVELLTWAKGRASRSPAIREALGVALYLAGDFTAAQRELLAYRRLSGRADQNHLIADSARAVGQAEKVAELVAEMERSEVAPERTAEGLMVLAGSRADRGDVAGALETLDRAGLHPAVVPPWQPRLWYLAGDLAERSGDRVAARDWFSAVLAVSDDYLDAAGRLAALD